MKVREYDILSKGKKGLVETTTLALILALALLAYKCMSYTINNVLVIVHETLSCKVEV
ncbi:hypothetical protein BWQ96_09407 [Gracilariopsis chorda]|uniref:Uncharacterized protein n=1 Tax=Gracilariopsis chorda TaxID=448386 RepID=A0A2V3IFS1_9FLOR|nr:hypothetical protein BWQ96_09407 [Gracilariopsis chorda]|eukprot:PXF40878.1 hypothetical protein BWQ96_09407 [Gracilariopsis chorda]